MIIPGVDPVTVEAIHLVIVVRPFVLAVVESRKRDAERILPVLQEDVGIPREFAFHRASRSRTDQAVVYLEVFEDKGHRVLLRHVQGVEPSDAVRTSEYERAVFKQTRGAVGELVPSDAVGLEVVDESACGAVVASEAVHRGHPDIALAVLLYGRYVHAGRAGHGYRTAIAACHQQTVGNRSRPEIAGTVHEHLVRGHLRAAYAGLYFLFGEEESRGFQ